MNTTVKWNDPWCIAGHRPVHVSPDEQRQLEQHFLAALAEARQYSEATERGVVPQCRLTFEEIADWYDLPLDGFERDDQTWHGPCFLMCDQHDRDGRGPFSVQRHDPSTLWTCQDAACQAQGDLRSLCERLQPPRRRARAAGADRQPVEAVWPEIFASFHMWRWLTADPIAASIVHNAAVAVLKHEAQDEALLRQIIAEVRGDLLRREFQRSADLGYRSNLAGTFGFSGLLFIIARRCSSRALRHVKASTRQTGRPFSGLPEAALNSIAAAADDEQLHRRATVVRLIDECPDADLRFIGHAKLADWSLRKIVEVYRRQGRRVSTKWVSARIRRLVPYLRQQMFNEAEHE